jgi:serine protease Do
MIKKITLAIITTILFTTTVAFASSDNILKTGFADIVEPIMPAVVNISTTYKDNHELDRYVQLFQRFGLFPGLEGEDPFGMLPGIQGEEKPDLPKRISLGSGFIIDPAGYIVTNYHVIEETGEITVKLNNDKQLKAKIIGVDPKTDLALLKVEDGAPLPFVKFGDSDKIRVGDWVIAIGNSFGLGNSVTAGIVSARARDIDKEGLVDDFIQTDAAINQGNSGGLMLNIEGEVVGVNTAIFSRSGDNAGIGFAIPATTAKVIIDQLQKTGKIKRGWLGVSVQPITPDMLEGFGLKEAKGSIIAEISKDSPAQKAGLHKGDIILQLGGKDITTTKKLQKIVAEAEIGKSLDVVILRKNKKTTLPVIIEALQEMTSSYETKPLSAEEPLEIVSGVVVQQLNQKTREILHLNVSVGGVIVKDLKRHSPWARKGLYKHDIIMECNQTPVTTPLELKQMIVEAQKTGKQHVVLLVLRKNKTFFISMPVK